VQFFNGRLNRKFNVGVDASPPVVDIARSVNGNTGNFENYAILGAYVYKSYSGLTIQKFEYRYQEETLYVSRGFQL
jgi:hypothetical protein